MARTSAAFSAIGFPHLVLKWSPAAGQTRKMLESSSMIWNNFPERFGHKSGEISDALQNSLSIGLSQARENTLERQIWRLAQTSLYRVDADAPTPYFLTNYQRSILRDFGELEWMEFVSLPLSRERERVLVLEAKTQIRLSDAMMQDASAIFAAFICVYQCLHRPIRLTQTVTSDDSVQASLSHREVQCLQWLAAGKTLLEAATILDISERTLRFHISNAKEKLGVSTTMQAVVAAALEYGFDPKDPRRSICQISRTPILKPVRKAG
nr:helix-turn-helix transcriptional regulator [Hyphomonas sp. Mor2]